MTQIKGNPILEKEAEKNQTLNVQREKALTQELEKVRSELAYVKTEEFNKDLKAYHVDLYERARKEDGTVDPNLTAFVDRFLDKVTQNLDYDEMLLLRDCVVSAFEAGGKGMQQDWTQFQ
ncbi:hypothetical protein HC026_09350 [Lactobacillus sp. LC28-10]|uniref:Uncharacterized protein n=1 Tax=Secundilactobacillus angelensis TaxID=2722706 RepID=A0ABX1L462_9LACO|nr:hypothetical protein [Secundilactobacillus angelensis]MCH5462624.1 hypothetical protein [Secundilactobacillus angelensis]NLR19116.1 hypothetical protein [Secundilactobacillus angelensis]